MNKEEINIPFFDKEGEPIDAKAWRALFEDKEYRIVASDDLPDGKFISTVWLGSDHNLMRPGREDHAPLIFETMVFPWKGNWDDMDCQRYATLGQAEKGHRKMVEKWKSNN